MTDENTSENRDLTHTTSDGTVSMVDVSEKPDTHRRASARGELHVQSSTIDAVRDHEIGKGDVLATARIGAIQAVKRTWDTIPLCHQISISGIETEFSVHDELIELTVTVETTGPTGCEMEALQGVSTGLNTMWDMVKSAEKDADGNYPHTAIQNIRVIEKHKTPIE